MTSWLTRPLGGLRARIAILLGVCLLGLGISIYGTLMTLTRQWLRDELETRARALAVQVASRVSTPLIVRDIPAIEVELGDLHEEPDVVGFDIFDLERVHVAGRAAPGDPAEGGVPSVDELLSAPPGAGPRVIDRGGSIHVVVPIVRDPSDRGAALLEARELVGGPSPLVDGRPIGWLHLAVSRARVDASLAVAMRLGLLVLFTVLALAALPIALVVRATMIPLREASELAREIAAGQLDRQLPVRTNDEVGALASSMNTMAQALITARAEARNEADALRVAFEAVGAIARGARRAPDAGTMFGIVASELRRVTGCDGVSLAKAGDEDDTLRFHHFDPPLPWGELRAGMALDTTLARRLSAAVESPVRLDVDHEPGPLVRGLARHGLRSVLIVPLVLDGGPRAALLLVGRRVDAFSPAEIEMVTGLANHLGAALEAAALRGRLERAFEELQTARSHLVRSERLRVAGEMASGVAHEFNNVLGAILGRAQLLQRQSQRGEITPLALQRSLRVMERAALDGGETVRRLRQFGSPVDPAASETVDLSSIALEATEVTRTRWENEAQAEDRPIVLEPRLEEGCWVLGRGSELREVFVNLILNAVDAMPRGGTLSISVFRDGDSVRGWVQDSGVGMDEEVRRRIFDPFFTTKGDRGTGLGMSVTYAIIRRHQGEISVFSELGFGTRMEMTFALALAPAAVAEVLPSGEKAHASLRVLVVDDEPSVRDLLADIVRALGHAAESFDSAVTALGRIERGSHDLILSDVGMPGMTGWEFARRVRTLDPDVTIVFVTGWGEEITPEAAEEAGGNLVVPKPFTLEQIAAALALASDRRDRGDLAA